MSRRRPGTARQRPLHRVGGAATGRHRHHGAVRQGRISVSDGPFAETKEALAGFYLIEARDLNEAIQLAAKIPPAAVGCIEVRPIRDIREQPNQGAQLA